MDAPKVTDRDEMLEASVLQHEDVLEAAALAYAQKHGSPEGKRYPVTLNVGSNDEPKLITIKDRSDEEKMAAATIAVRERADAYEKETAKLAKFKLSNMSEVEAVDFVRELSPGDRQIYLTEAKKAKLHKALFDIFGQPEKE